MNARIGQLLDELREVRRENAELRRQVELARGLRQHQPYALPLMLPTPVPQCTPAKSASSGKTRMAGDLSPGLDDPPPVGGAGGDVVMSSPIVDAEQKRARRSLGDSLEEAASSASLLEHQPHGLVPPAAPSSHVE